MRVNEFGVIATADDIARELLMGKMIDAATKQLRSLSTPWGALPMHRQEAILEEVKLDVSRAVIETVDLIASDNRARFRAGVESVTFKDGVKAVLQMKNTEASHELADSAGGSVLIVIEDPARYTEGQEGMPQSEHDQRPLM